MTVAWASALSSSVPSDQVGAVEVLDADVADPGGAADVSVGGRAGAAPAPPPSNTSTTVHLAVGPGPHDEAAKAAAVPSAGPWWRTTIGSATVTPAGHVDDDRVGRPGRGAAR